MSRTDDSNKSIGDLADLVDAMFEVGRAVNRAQHDHTVSSEYVAERLRRLMARIERYLEHTDPVAPTMADLSADVARRVADLGRPGEPISEYPGRRFYVPKRPPRPTDEVLREQFHELRRRGLGCRQ